MGVGTYIDELRISNIQRTSFNHSIGQVSMDLNMFAGIRIDAPVGASISVEATSTLGPTNWLTLTNLVLPAQPFIFIDYRSPTNPRQFYRVVRLD